MGLNIAVFVGMLLTGISPLSPSPGQLVRWGANWGPLTLSSQPWRLLTSNYVHIGLIHLFFNMWCLLSLGALAERILDPKTYLLIYSLCGLAGSCVSVWWHPKMVGAGASGAIFGLAGAVLAALYLGNFPFRKEAIRPILKSLLSFAGWNLFLGLRAGVDNSAHVGGLLMGLGLGATFSKFLTADHDLRNRVRTTVAITGAVVLLVGFIGTRHEYRYPAHSAITPEDYFAAPARAKAALQKNDFNAAVPELQKIVAVDPTNADAHYLLGRAYLGAREPDAARASFERALEIKPHYRNAEAGLGMAKAAANRKEGDAFLAVNRLKRDVIVLPDGLQYRVLTESRGPKPTASDLVTVNYRATLTNGKEVDSSSKHSQPVRFRPNELIKGWSEALQMMPVGSKWQLFIPADLAFGDRGARDIAPGDTVIFEVELLSIERKK
jgi:rhomboid protease GluP